MRPAPERFGPPVLPRSLLDRSFCTRFRGGYSERSLIHAFTMGRFLIVLSGFISGKFCGFRSPDVSCHFGPLPRMNHRCKITVRYCKQTSYGSIGDLKKQGFSWAENNEIPSTLSPSPSIPTSCLIPCRIREFFPCSERATPLMSHAFPKYPKKAGPSDMPSRAGAQNKRSRASTSRVRRRGICSAALKGSRNHLPRDQRSRLSS